MSLEIIKIEKDKKQLDSQLLDKHRKVVLEAEDLYPGIHKWYDIKAKPGLEKGDRIGYLVQKDDIPVGAAIARQGLNGKICTVRVRNEAMHEGIGKILFLLLAMNLRRETKQIHFTAPEHLCNKYQTLFDEIGFKNL